MIWSKNFSHVLMSSKQKSEAKLKPNMTEIEGAMYSTSVSVPCATIALNGINKNVQKLK